MKRLFGKGDVRVKKESDEWVTFLQVTPLGCAMPTVDGQEVSPSVNPSPVEIPSLSLILQWLWSTDQPLGRLELSIPASLDTNLSMVTWKPTKDPNFFFLSWSRTKIFLYFLNALHSGWKVTENVSFNNIASKASFLGVPTILGDFPFLLLFVGANYIFTPFCWVSLGANYNFLPLIVGSN